jgi:hypothetical protein
VTTAAVALTSTWAELFPAGAADGTHRARWAVWLRLARRKDREQAVMWARGHECHNCAHRRGGWCVQIGLPCTVNPILTVRHGMIGMACIWPQRFPMRMTTC